MNGDRWGGAPTLTLLLGVTALGLGVWGQADARGSAAGPADWVEYLLGAAQLFTLEPPNDAPANWRFRLARVAAAVTVGVGLVGLLSHVLPEWRDRWRLRALALRAGTRRLLGGDGSESGFVDRRLPAHAVICGLGRIGIQLVRNLRRPGSARTPVVVLESDPASPRLATARSLGALVLHGDARDITLLRRARLAEAGELFVVSGDDSINVDIVTRARQLLLAEPSGRKRLRCFVNLLSPRLAEVCRAHQVFRDQTDALDVEILNVLENSARLLVTEHLGTEHAPARHEVAYYILLGFGEMGRIAAREAAKLAHFANRKRLRMSIIDDFAGDAELARARDRFVAQHPGFCPDPDFRLTQLIELDRPDADDWAFGAFHPAEPRWQTRKQSTAAIEYAVNAEFLPLGPDVADEALLEALRRRLTAGVAPCLLVCFDDDRRNFEAGCHLLPRLRQIAPNLSVYVYLPQEGGLVDLLNAHPDEVDAHHTLAGLHAFGACEDSANVERVRRSELVQMARAFHEVYRAKSAGGSRGGIGVPDWESLSWDRRSANEEAAAHVDIKLRALGCARASRGAGGERIATLPELELLMEVEHNRWVAERLLSGWRYGPRSDPERTRETIVPWSVLTGRSHRDASNDEDQVRAIIPAIEATGDHVVNLGRA